MPEEPLIRLPLNPEDEATPDEGQSFEKLRHLILAPEQEDLARLRERLENPDHRASDLSAVLPEAIQLRRQQDGGEEALGEALTPTVEAALRESVRKNPGTLADALFPVMGPAIRRSILQTLRLMFESFNQAMEQSFSLRGLQWRFEALRTGRPFSEVVLMHSLVFRTEQVFLIHKKTGLPLCHVVAPAVAMEDASLVSGMLSAIQDFVRDSFHSPDGQAIEKMQIGELEVWIEDGPHTVLAAVIRGMAPEAYRTELVETVEQVERKFSEQLEHFEGETSPFVAATEDLTRCLGARYRESESMRPKPYIFVFAGVVIALLAGWWGSDAWRNHRWHNYVDALNSQPGIVVTSLSRQHGHFVIAGLRDPMSADPQAILRSQGLDPQQAQFRWGSYYALDDAILQQRAIALLKPPGGATLAVTDGTLHAQGIAPDEWVASLPARASAMPGIRDVDASQLIGKNEAEFRRLTAAIQSVIITFPVGSADLSETETSSLDALAPEVAAIVSRAQLLHKNATVEIIGHSDSTGLESTNEPLSANRAWVVQRQLARDGAPRAALHPTGVAAAQPLRPEVDEQARQENRSVTFRVSTLAAPKS